MGRRAWSRCLLLAVSTAAVVGVLLSGAVDANTASCQADLPQPAAVDASVLSEVYQRLQALGNVSDSGERLQRTFLSPAHRQAAVLIQAWMVRPAWLIHTAFALKLSHAEQVDAGLHSWVDAVGNVHGTVEGENPCGGALVLGSHYDTVLDAGKYDGALGVIAAIGAVKAFLQTKRTPACPVAVVAFSDEEGVRFQSTFLGSRAFAGTLTPEMLATTDADGTTLGQALVENGAPSEEGLLQEAIRASKTSGMRSYVEAHIEQGPILEGVNQPLAAVIAIAGQTFLTVTMQGSQGHAGTVPMPMRQDTLAAAAEIVTSLERRCQVDGVSVVEEEGLVCTVGRLAVWPGASNVIAGRVNLTVDIRSRQDAVRKVVVADTKAAITAICSRRGVNCTIEQKHEAGALQCAPQLVKTLEDAITAATGAVSAPRIVSGAGHDGLALSLLGPVGMLFVRCRQGISHSPLEFAAKEDVDAAVTALTHVLSALDRPL